MIVALLIVIVLILLFGSAAVKGWLKGAALWIGGLVCFAICVSLLAPVFQEGGPLYLGQNGPLYFVFGIVGLMAIAGLLAVILPEANDELPQGKRRRRRRPR